MRKKVLFFSLPLLFLLGAFYYISLVLTAPPPSLYAHYCPFCDPTVLKLQSFYEDDLAIALYTHKPTYPGHCLIIPKRHVERFERLTSGEITQMGETVKKVNRAVVKVFGTYPYLLLQKNGYEVGQTVPHIHIHYIPRKAHDNSMLSFLFKLFIADAKSPMPREETEIIVQKLKAAVLSFDEEANHSND